MQALRTEHQTGPELQVLQSEDDSRGEGLLGWALLHPLLVRRPDKKAACSSDSQQEASQVARM